MSTTNSISFSRDLLNWIGEWKITSLKRLFNYYGTTKADYHAIARKIRKLEKDNAVTSKIINTNEKVIYLSDLGVTLSNYDNNYNNNTGMIHHDLWCSILLEEFLKFEKFKSGSLHPEHKLKGIIPDILIDVDGEPGYQLGVEVELTQKSTSRVKEKFIDYSKDQEINHVLYISNKRSIISKYQKELSRLNESIQRRFVFMFLQDSKINGEKIHEFKCEYLNKEHQFDQIFK